MWRHSEDNSYKASVHIDASVAASYGTPEMWIMPYKCVHRFQSESTIEIGIIWRRINHPGGGVQHPDRLFAPLRKQLFRLWSDAFRYMYVGHIVRMMSQAPSVVGRNIRSTGSTTVELAFRRFSRRNRVEMLFRCTIEKRRWRWLLFSCNERCRFPSSTLDRR